MSVKILTSESIQEFINVKSKTALASQTATEVVSIVDFWAEWCGPCKVLSPFLDSMAQKYEGTIKVGKLNVSNSPEMGAEYKITNIPCLVVFKDGREIDRMVGFKGKDSLEVLFSKHSKSS